MQPTHPDAGDQDQAWRTTGESRPRWRWVSFLHWSSIRTASQLARIGCLLLTAWPINLLCQLLEPPSFSLNVIEGRCRSSLTALPRRVGALATARDRVPLASSRPDRLRSGASSRPVEQGCDLLRRLSLHGRDGVAVDVEREGDGGVA